MSEWILVELLNSSFILCIVIISTSVFLLSCLRFCCSRVNPTDRMHTSQEKFSVRTELRNITTHLARLEHSLLDLRSEQTSLQSEHLEVKQTLLNTCTLLTDKLEDTVTQLEKAVAQTENAFSISANSINSTLHNTLVEIGKLHQELLGAQPRSVSSLSALPRREQSETSGLTQQPTTSLSSLPIAFPKSPSTSSGELWTSHSQPQYQSAFTHLSSPQPKSLPFSSLQTQATNSIATASKLPHLSVPGVGSSPPRTEQTSISNSRQSGQSEFGHGQHPGSLHRTTGHTRGTSPKDPLIGAFPGQGNRRTTPGAAFKPINFYEDISEPDSPQVSHKFHQQQLQQQQPDYSPTSPTRHRGKEEDRKSFLLGELDNISLFDDIPQTSLFHQRQDSSSGQVQICLSEQSLDSTSQREIPSGPDYTTSLVDKRPNSPRTSKFNGISEVSDLPSDNFPTLPRVGRSHIVPWSRSPTPSTVSPSRLPEQRVDTHQVDRPNSSGRVQPVTPRRSASFGCLADISKIRSSPYPVQTDRPIRTEPTSTKATSRRRRRRNRTRTRVPGNSPQRLQQLQTSKSPVPQSRQSVTVSVSTELAKCNTDPNPNSPNTPPDSGYHSETRPTPAQGGGPRSQTPDSISSINSAAYPRLPNPRSLSLDRIFKRRLPHPSERLPSQSHSIQPPPTYAKRLQTEPHSTDTGIHSRKRVYCPPTPRSRAGLRQERRPALLPTPTVLPHRWPITHYPAHIDPTFVSPLQPTWRPQRHTLLPFPAHPTL